MLKHEPRPPLVRGRVYYQFPKCPFNKAVNKVKGIYRKLPHRARSVFLRELQKHIDTVPKVMREAKA